jgi:hypothetical protein
MILLPADPSAVPSEERARAARELISKLRPGAHEVAMHISKVPEFFHAGTNFQSVFCPFCEVDITEWWREKMRALGDDFRCLTTGTPCCHRATSLNDLDYLEQQGFGCFALELMNPGADLEPEELRQMESIVGLPLRIVWCHI